MKKYLFRSILLLVSILFVGWGSVGHRIINKNTTLSFPSNLNFLLYWADSLSSHANDADIRRNWDPNEEPKHYIDIDNYPQFVSTGRIPHSFDSLIVQYGYTFVLDQGILPWTIMKTVDSLQSAFGQGNWQKAMLITADLGHYVGDCHMPLHVTRNYNGQYTNQPGVHSRYESNMIGTYQQQIIYSGDTISYVSNISDFVFEMIYANYKYVDSVLQADIIAKNYAGGNYNNTYYQKLWELTKGYTVKLFKNASYNLARLIFTAWKNAGEPVITNVGNEFVALNDFKLEQNYPNPFNPSTRIQYQVSSDAQISLKVYDVLGNEVATLVDGYKLAGTYHIEFHTGSSIQQRVSGVVNLVSGIYFYQLKAGNSIQTKKMILVR